MSKKKQKPVTVMCEVCDRVTLRDADHETDHLPLYPEGADFLLGYVCLDCATDEEIERGYAIARSLTRMLNDAGFTLTIEKETDE